MGESVRRLILDRIHLLRFIPQVTFFQEMEALFDVMVVLCNRLLVIVLRKR